MSSVIDLANAKQETPTPEPLYRPLPPTPSYPVKALGSIMAGAAMALHEDVQAPLAMCAQSVLAASSLAVMSHADVVIDGRKIPTELFFVTLGETGERKSAIDKLVTAPIEHHQKELAIQVKMELNKYEMEMAVYKLKQANAKNEKDPNTYAKELANIGPAPREPVAPVILCSDPTMEGIIKLLERQPFIGLFSDEGGRMLGGYAMSNDMKLRTITLLSKLWDGSTVDRVRSGDGASVLHGRRMAMHLMIQPAIAQSLLADPMAQDQGFLGRVLLSFPDTMVGNQPYNGRDASANSRLKRFQSQLSELMAKPTEQDETGALQLGKLTLSTSAKKVYVAFANHMNEQLQGDELRAIRGLACKAGEQALRIAGVIHQIEHPDSLEVDAEAMKGATDLMNYYLQEALRLQAGSVINVELEIAERLLLWLHERNTKEVITRDVYQRAPIRSIRNKTEALKHLQILENHGYLIPMGADELGKRKAGWLLTPVGDVAQVARVARGQV